MNLFSIIVLLVTFLVHHSTSFSMPSEKSTTVSQELNTSAHTYRNSKPTKQVEAHAEPTRQGQAQDVYNDILSFIKKAEATLNSFSHQKALKEIQVWEDSGVYPDEIPFSSTDLKDTVEELELDISDLKRLLRSAISKKHLRINSDGTYNLSRVNPGFLRKLRRDNLELITSIENNRKQLLALKTKWDETLQSPLYKALTKPPSIQHWQK